MDTAVTNYDERMLARFYEVFSGRLGEIDRRMNFYEARISNPGVSDEERKECYRKLDDLHQEYQKICNKYNKILGAFCMIGLAIIAPAGYKALIN